MEGTVGSFSCWQARFLRAPRPQTPTPMGKSERRAARARAHLNLEVVYVQGYRFFGFRV